MNFKYYPVAALLAAVHAGAFAADGGCPVSRRVRGHENTEWSISYSYHLTDAKKDLPRVLLIGDSICHAYKNGVQHALEGKCNVSYWCSSYGLTSPEYFPLLEVHLDTSKYDVVHFNNGLHSLGADVSEYRRSLERALRMIREKQPQAVIVWANSTPLKDADRTAKVREFNAAAAVAVAGFPDVRTNDLFALLDPLDRDKHWSDMYHHRDEAIALCAERVLGFVVSAVDPAKGKAP